MRMKQQMCKGLLVVVCAMMVLTQIHWHASTAKAATNANVTVDLSSIVNPDFLGIGAEYDPFHFMEESQKDGFNEQWWELEKLRLAKLKPDVVRVWFQPDWMEPINDNDDPTTIDWTGMQTDSSRMQAVYKVFDYLQSQNIDIMLIAGLVMNEENQSWLGFDGLPRPELSAPTDLAEWGEWVSATLQQLITVKGYTNIKYVMSYNEPNLASFALPAGISKPVYYKDMYQAIHDRLTTDGIRSQVKLIGPDESGAANWTQYAVTYMDNVLDIYDGHAYGQSYMSMPGWLSDRLTHVEPTGKPFMVTEFAAAANPDTRKTYAYGVDVADLIVSGMRNGAASMMYWRLADQRLPEPLNFLDDNSYGSWRWLPITATPQYSYYSLGLFTRYIDAHAEVLSTESDDPDLHVTSVRNPDGNYSIYVVNSSLTESKSITFDFISSDLGRTVRRHLYSDSLTPNATANVIASDRKWSHVTGQFSDSQLPAHSVAVYTTVSETPQIEIDHADVSVAYGEKVKFKANVVNGHGGVHWSVVGGSEYGTINNGGVYRAPTEMPPMPQAILKARSNQDPSVYSYAVVRFEAVGLIATGVEDEILLDWEPTIGADSYNIKRSASTSGPYTTIATGVTEAVYTDTSVDYLHRYYYTVSAVNEHGEIGDSRQAFASPLSSSMSDDFSGDRMDSTKWTLMNLGLRSSTANALTAEVADGKFAVSGTNDVNYWSGKSIRSVPTFRATPESPLTVEVDRVSLDGSGTGFRSAVWLYVGPSQYIHFAQSGEFGYWAYNKDGSGDNVVWNDADRGNHRMKLVHDGTQVHFYVDDVLYGSTPVSWNSDIKVILTGEACVIGDTVSVEFDNLSVSKSAVIE